MRTLFESPRVAELAARTSTHSPRSIGPRWWRRARPEFLPLSPAQQRMWFLNRFDGASVAYNIPFALRLSGALDTGALQAAMSDVVARHESLRTMYPVSRATGTDIDGTPTQSIVAAADAVVSLEPIAVADADLPAVIRELAETTFDVTTEIPVRMRLFQVADTEFVLAAVMHHIAADGSSVAPFVADLMRAYTARLADAAPGWAPPAVQFADYALWQRELLGDESDPESVAAQQVRYWQTQLAGLPDQLALPTDRPRPARQSLRGDKVSFTVDAIYAALIALGRGNGATLFMVVHAAFAALLARVSGTADIAVGTPNAGRGEAELDEVVFFFFCRCSFVQLPVAQTVLDVLHSLPMQFLVIPPQKCQTGSASLSNKRRRIPRSGCDPAISLESPAHLGWVEKPPVQQKELHNHVSVLLLSQRDALLSLHNSVSTQHHQLTHTQQPPQQIPQTTASSCHAAAPTPPPNRRRSIQHSLRLTASTGCPTHQPRAPNTNPITNNNTPTPAPPSA